MGLRFELDGLGIGYAVAQLYAFTAANDSGRGVEVLDGQLRSTKLL